MQGALEAGHTVEKIFLKDKEINYCIGCGVCFNGEKPCSQNDDMTGILAQMIESDVIVMATPVYFYTMCGQMKTFIDRICARYQELKNKEFVYIMTAAEPNEQAMERTIEEFRGLLDCLDNPQERGIIKGVGAWNKGDIKNSETMQQAFKMGITIE